MLNIFCKECATKPGWPFDLEKSFPHSCQRCFRVVACNDYSWKLRQQGIAVAPSEPAPQPKELVQDSKTHIDITLPRPKVNNFEKAAMSAGERAEVDKKEAEARAASEKPAEEKKKSS